jgi:2',3'-cyclic-nucleotide 2'-phosphodiesterase (5'-nucleotidase family)
MDTPEARARLGEDDGFQVAAFFGAEMMGSLDDCGCPSHPEGGLPWRFGYTEGFRAAYPDAGTLQLDAGHSMASIIDAQGVLFADSVVKCEWMMKAFDTFEFDAVNISHQDIYYLAGFLKDAATWEQALTDHPSLQRFVSANLQPVREGLVVPPAYVVRAVKAERLGSKAVRFGLVGLTEKNPVLPDQTGYTVNSPADALAAVLPKVRAESDVVIVLLYGPPDMAISLSKQFEGQVDVFIVAHTRARDAEPTITTGGNVTYARQQTKKLGELRMKFDGAKLASMTNRYVSLDAQLPKDPLAEQLTAESKEAIKKAQKERFTAGGAGGK